MQSILYIKYGELFLKGKNKHLFIKSLLINIKNLLQQYKQLVINSFHDAIVIDKFKQKDRLAIIHLLKQVPGIKWIIVANVIKQNYKTLCTSLVKSLKPLVKTKQTFKIITKRIDKTFIYNSMDVSKKIGGVILKNFKEWTVDIHQPSTSIYIEIKPKQIIFYHEKIAGMGGFPMGTNGRVLLLLSGGLDSPVAAKLLIKKGFVVDFLTFITPPHTSVAALNKVKKLVDIISLSSKLYQPKLYICNFTQLQHEIKHIYLSSYQITIMRRYFFRIAATLAKTNRYHAIATGESLGQVASQTIQSMDTIEKAIPDCLVLRPLLTYDKEQIIALAKEFGTYTTSIIAHADSCSLFVPTNPVTKPQDYQAIKLEKSLDLIDKLLEKTIKNNIEIYKK